MVGLFLNEQPRSGVDNMTIDDCMLMRAAELDQPLLRFYRWSEPTLSLGYFQKFDDRQLHPASLCTNVVRRTTGGGAIIHHFDWTYSIALPESCAGRLKNAPPALGASPGLYDCVHSAVVNWLREQGWPAHTVEDGCSPASPPSSDCNFLCFERRCTGDVVVENAKVMGSAQRRSSGALLQHGSLLLARSDYAPNLPGLAELRSDKTANDEPDAFFETSTETLLSGFQRTIVAALVMFTGVQWQESCDLNHFLSAADFSAYGKFKDQAWTQRR